MPKKWEKANIMPILKNKNATDYNNCRELSAKPIIQYKEQLL